MRLSKYEKETIILTSEGDDTAYSHLFLRKDGKYAVSVVKNMA